MTEQITLAQIIREQTILKNRLKTAHEKYEAIKKDITKQLSKLDRLDKILHDDLDMDKVMLAEQIIHVSGDPYGKTDQMGGSNNSIAMHAINDIAHGCKHLKSQYFGNKIYEGLYQRS